MRRRHHTSLLAGIAALVLLLEASTAHGYVRTLTSRGRGIAWQESCVFLVPPLVAPSDLNIGETLAAIRTSADAWSTVPGSYIRFVVEDAQPDLKAEYKPSGGNVNVIVFVDSGWRHEPGAAALTTITYITSPEESDDGRIIDTDVEVNTQNYRISTTGDEDRNDLASILTHELGHALGLDHPCDDGMVVPTPVDHEGNTIPPCFPIEDLPTSITDTTMFGYVFAGTTDKVSLEADDMAGLEAIYPLAADPNNCAPPDIVPKETCNCTTGPRGGLWVLLPLILFALWRRRP